MEQREPRYGEFRAAADLDAFVACTWIGVGRGDAPTRVLPDGCVDLIYSPGRAPFVAGPDTSAKLETLPRGPYAGIRFRPGAAAVLGLPARMLRDLRVPVGEVWPRDAAERLADALAAAHTDACRLGALEAAVRVRARRMPGPDPAVRAAVRAIGVRLATGAAPLEPAAAVPVGERQLRRRFADAVGYGPKQLERVLRLQRFVAAARIGGPRVPLAALALASGYADQAHLTRECRALAGVTPRELRTE